MEKKEIENKQIIIYWWNFGRKTLDFKGTYKEYLKNKDIDIKEIDKVDKHYYRISFSCGSSNFIIQMYGHNPKDVFDVAIKTFLQYLGDRHLFIDGYNKEHRINWR